MSAAWRKVIGDIGEAPGRMALVVLAVFVGTMTAGTALGVRAILTREVAGSFAATYPPSAILWLDGVDEAVVTEATACPGVEAAEAWRLVRARVEAAPGEWRPLRIFAVRDFNDIRVSTFTHAGGDWPPRDGEVLVEQSALPVLRAGRGDTLRVRLPGGKIAGLRVGGTVHDPGQAPGWMDQVAYAYCTTKTLEALGQGGFDELRLVIGGDGERASQVAAEVAARLRERGKAVHRVEVPRREHPHADHMGSMLAVLQVFSALALLLAGAMAANVLAALMARQVRQIGIMKTLGATSSQVAWIYLRLVLLLSAVAVAPALPVAGWTAGWLASFIASHLNLSVADTSWPWWLPLAVAAAGVGVPVATAALAVRRAARMTAREAVSHHGTVPPSGGAGWGLPFGWGDRVTSLALRNTFRRPGRLALAAGTLALGGAVVLTAANVHASLTAGLDATLAVQGHDIDVRLLKSAPRGRLANRAGAVPGVKEAEAWGMTLAALEAPGAGPGRPATERYTLFAPPAGTRFHKVPLVAGRWPRPGEADAIVANRTLADREPLARHGGEVTLFAQGRRLAVRVVGVVEEIAPPSLYTNDAAMAALTGQPDRAGALRVTTEAGAEQAVSAELEEALAGEGWMPALVMTRAEFRASLLDHFQIVLLCLLGAGGSAVVVGALGVATSMGINVLERSREIAVARAIGATRGVVLRMLMLEGLALAVLSVVAGFLIALPASALLVGVIGDIGPHVRLPVVVSWSAVIGWVFAATAITLTACLLAARRAVGLPVREVLAHE